MKYILRIIVVILLIGGITFGVIQCNNKKSNEQAYSSSSVECIQIGRNSMDYAGNFIDNGYDYLGDIYRCKVMVSKECDQLTSFVAELNYAKNVDGKAVSNLSSSIKTLNNYVTNQKKDSNEFLNKTQQTNDQEILKRYVNEFAKNYKSFTKLFLNTSLEIANGIKTYVYNGSENYEELNNFINEINSSLQNSIFKEA